ncbi:MAG: hypothetical protein GVY36_13240 [Verrucomicrobia bacterium]|jgi:hypothetical protein|nr:hypothetical protein [Verrucomicrobiota bacterium]
MLSVKNLIKALALTAAAAAAPLLAQPTLETYLGPYEQPHAGQFEGDWTRSEGTYSFEISVEDGEVTPRYFNPDPINVESATLVETEAGGLQLQVVLRDQGYPGSTYTLQYIPQYRILAGTYTIPGQPPAEVYFKQ